MKHLVIIRHGKTEKENEKGDFFRELEQRGENDIETVSKILKKLELLPDMIISSNAIRAKKSAAIVSKVLEYNGKISLESLFYDGNHSDIINIISKADKNIENLFIVGHNPLFERLGAALSGGANVMLATSGVFVLESEAASWQETDEMKWEIKYLISPKMV